jgi:membrane-bound lytic murein transglycosylase D
VRFQLGQADRFRAGLVRSGTWKPYIYEALDKQGLPRELAALPHVESSFDPTAYSKVGRRRHVAIHALDRRPLHADRPHRR